MRCRNALVLLLFPSLSAQTEQALLPGRVDGTVIGPDEKPVPLADVWATVNGKEVARIRTDASGFFTFHRLPLGTVTIHGTREDRTLGRASVGLAEDQTEATVRVRVFAGGAIRGRVVDQEGEPIAGAHVVISSTVSSTDLDASAITDEHGRFSFEHFPAGAAQLWSVARGFDMTEHPCEVPNVTDQTLRLEERAGKEWALQDMSKILQQVTVRPYRSSGGRHSGVQILQINRDLGKRVGLRSGDVILQVNGVPTLTRSQTLETVSSFLDSGILAFRVRLMTMGRIESREYIAPQR